MPASLATSTVRWTRFGHDRLYVTGPEGSRLGWVDLATRGMHPTAPEHADTLLDALTTWERASQPDGGPGDDSARPDPPQTGAATRKEEAPAAVAPPWEDLALVRPGAAARAEAVALREAAPVRTAVARLLGLPTAERAWRIGADGEELVAARLGRLTRRDPRWRVLHAVRVGRRGADIDHLVLGPGGVFSLNAKHHPGATVWVGGDTVLVNGSRQPYVRNSRHEAARAARLLSASSGLAVDVRGVVVPVRADSVTVRTAPPDVAVVPARRLPRWLRSRPEVLDESSVAQLYEVARRSTTWRPSGD